MSKKKMTDADRFFIEVHADRTAEELAEKLDLPVEAVQACLAQQKPKTKFMEKDGMVAMTQAQSTLDDEAAGTSPFVEKKDGVPNDEYLKKRVGRNIHVIDPDKPVR